MTNSNAPGLSLQKRFQSTFATLVSPLTPTGSLSSSAADVGKNGNAASAVKTPWFTYSVQQVADTLKTDPNRGLTHVEANERIAQYGRNEFNVETRNTLLHVILTNVFNAMNIILLIAMAISIGFKDYIEAVVLAIVFALNSAIGIVQEYSSEKTMESLRKMASPTARVLRDGLVDVIGSGGVVPGDILHLRTGDIVPADVRLIEVVNFETDEALLTGESLPVRKHINIVQLANGATVGDRKNMAFKNSMVTKGRAVAIVVETGLQTQVGLIAKLIANETAARPTQKAPLQMQIDRLMYYLLGMALIMGFVVIAANRFIVDNQILLYATAVGIAMIPEGLPIVITVTLSISIRRLAMQKAVVRRTSALLSLGEIGHVCSDKTGTLTEGKMTAVRGYIGKVDYEITGSGETPTGNMIENGSVVVKPEIATCQQDHPVVDLALMVCTLCSSATVTFDEKDKKWKTVGDPTEIALEVLAVKMNYIRNQLRGPQYKFLAEMPFDNALKRMTVIYDRISDGKRVAFIKGGLEAVTKRCTAYHASQSLQTTPVDDDFWKTIRDKTEEYGKQGMRVLALGYKVMENNGENITLDNRDEVEKEFVFVGLIGIKDPPRKESKDAVRCCHIAGIDVHMVTGDFVATAETIAKQIGIISPEADPAFIKTAAELDAMSDKELDELEHFPLVIARCAPETKVKIVNALHRKGKYCAMTGDGTNDAPALKKAHVGFAMGLSGSDVAKQASDIILTDDNFSTIVKAIAEGRRIFTNIVKLSKHLLTTNVAEVVLLIIGLALRDSNGEAIYPMSPIQILWLNMLTSSPIAISLGMEDVDVNDLLREPPRSKDAGVISKDFLIDTLVYGTWAGILALGTFMISLAVDANYFSAGTFLTQCNKYNEATYGQCEGVFVARAVSFYTLVLIFLIYGYIVRHPVRSIFHELRNPIRDARALDPFYDPALDSAMPKPRNRGLLVSVFIGLLLTIPTSYIPGLNLNLLSQGVITWQWGLIIPAQILFVAGAEMFKLYKRRKNPSTTYYGVALNRVLTMPKNAQSLLSLA